MPTEVKLSKRQFMTVYLLLGTFFLLSLAVLGGLTYWIFDSLWHSVESRTLDEEQYDSGAVLALFVGLVFGMQLSISAFRWYRLQLAADYWATYNSRYGFNAYLVLRVLLAILTVAIIVFVEWMARYVF